MRSVKSTPLWLVAVVAAALVGALVSTTLLHAGHHGSAPTAAQKAAANWASEHPFAGNFKPDGITVDQCAAKAADGSLPLGACRQQALGNIAYRQGPKAAFAELDKRVKADASNSWRTDAHLIQHSIGAATLLRLHGNTGQAFALGDNGNQAIGQGGYYHGILLRALRDTPVSQLGAKAAKLCDDTVVRSSPFLTYTCLHGMGHGLMIHTGENLPAALKACDVMQSSSDRYSCENGAFMENYGKFLGVTMGPQSRYIKDDDLLYPCDAATTEQKRACYIQVATRIAPAVGWDWSRVADVCRTAESNFVQLCFYSTGGWVWNRTQGNTMGIVDACRQLGNDGDPMCIFGASAWIIGNYDPSGAQASAFCRQVVPGDRQVCYEGIGYVAAGFGPAQRAQVCATQAGSFENECLHPRAL